MFNMVKPQAPSSDGESPRKTGAMASHGSMPPMHEGCRVPWTCHLADLAMISWRVFQPRGKPHAERKSPGFSHGFLPFMFPLMFLAKLNRGFQPHPTQLPRFGGPKSNLSKDFLWFHRGVEPSTKSWPRLPPLQHHPFINRWYLYLRISV